MDEITKWLVEQMGMVVIMAVVIWWLAKRLVNAEKVKDKLSEDVIKLTAMWETKASSMTEDKEEDLKHKEEILRLLSEIKGMLNKQD
tara:strand:- start:351 stop:611 length:261 start_codon:yes stop_codon:yes gene_type:complete